MRLAEFTQVIAERNADVMVRYERGETLAAIGLRYGLSRQRIEQIVKATVKSKRERPVSKTELASRAARARREEKVAARAKLVAELRALVIAGMSIRQAGIKLGITTGQLSSWTRDTDIPDLTKFGKWRGGRLEETQ